LEPNGAKYILGNYDQPTLDRFITLFEEINNKYNIFFDENRKIGNDLLKRDFVNDGSAFDMDLLTDSQGRLYKTFVDINATKGFNFYNFIGNKLGNIDRYKASMVGGTIEQNDILSGMKITWLNKIEDRDYVVSLSAFDGGYDNPQITQDRDAGSVSSASFGHQYGGEIVLNPKYIRKNIVVYLTTLIEALKDFRVHLNHSLWKIRIYIDKTLTTERARKNETIAQFLNYVLDADNKNFIEIAEVDMQNFKLKNRVSHIGLVGVMFRFHAMMDPTIKNCFVGEIDNYPTNILYDILDRFFRLEPDFKIMTFRPLIYNRKNEKNKCIPNFFAGMFAFKKNKNEVLNPYLWANSFVYMDRLYAGYKNKMIQPPQCIPLRDNPSGTRPFEFGFEEQAISNVIIANYMMNNDKLYVVPLFWLSPIYFIKYYIKNILLKKFNLLTIEFKRYFVKILRFDINIFIEELLWYHTFDNNLHIMTLLECFLYDYLIANNNEIELLTADIKKDFESPKYTKVVRDGRTFIKIFDDSAKMTEYKRLSGNLLLYTVYPGFELSINISSVNELLNNLRSGVKLNLQQYIAFNQSHSFNLQLYQLIRDYCPQYDPYKPPKPLPITPSGDKVPLIYKPDERLTELSGGTKSGNYADKYKRYKIKYLHLKELEKQNHQVGGGNDDYSSIKSCTKLMRVGQGYATTVYLDKTTNKIYKLYYDKTLMNNEVMALGRLNKIKDYLSFEVPELYGYDDKNLITSVSVIKEPPYVQIHRNIGKSLNFEVNKIFSAMADLHINDIVIDEFSLEKGHKKFIFNNSYFKRPITQILAKYGNDNEYIITIKKYFEAIGNREFNVYERQLLNDFSLDVFINKNNDKLMLHDWNASVKGPVEFDLGIAISNIAYIVVTQHSVVQSVSEVIKEALVQYSTKTGIVINYELLQVALTYVSTLKDLVRMAAKISNTNLETGDLVKIVFDGDLYYG
jgi:hypothetical protein